MNIFTHEQLHEMWKRPVEKQYNIAISKILEAINSTNGDLTIDYSGGKDSSLLLDMYCELISQSEYREKPIKVVFADTTNETQSMLNFIKEFIPRCEEKYGITIDFTTIRPKGITWASFVKENGIPLISKEQSRRIRVIKRDMIRTGCDYETVQKLHRGGEKAVKELYDIGFSNSGVLYMTGYASSKEAFGGTVTLSQRWMPMLKCNVDLTDECCTKIKESSLNSLPQANHMTGEQAMESSRRIISYLQTGCNIRLDNGLYRSKPFGAMTTDGILFALDYRKVPMCPDYGEIVKDEDGHYRCTKAQRTGCALCGFGCQYDTERFVRLQETEPAKIKFAFKPVSEGGAGYGEAVAFMNEYCGTKVLIPDIT